MMPSKRIHSMYTQANAYVCFHLLYPKETFLSIFKQPVPFLMTEHIFV